MNHAMGIRACIVLLVFTGSASARSARSVEIPIGQTGDVQVAEIVARLARASGVPIDRPPASLTLSTQGLSRRTDQGPAVRGARPRGGDHLPARRDGPER